MQFNVDLTAILIGSDKYSKNALFCEVCFDIQECLILNFVQGFLSDFNVHLHKETAK